jgi:hypothetical protein
MNSCLSNVFRRSPYLVRSFVAPRFASLLDAYCIEAGKEKAGGEPPALGTICGNDWTFSGFLERDVLAIK